MENIYKDLLSGKPFGNIIASSVQVQDEEIGNQAKQLSQEEIQEFGKLASRNIRLCGVEAVLKVGFWLDLQCHLASVNGKKQVFDDLLSQVGISRTQGCRARNVWKNCGARLVGHSKLLSRFSAESLKITASSTLPEEARDEIFKKAAEGQKITIRLAGEISQKYVKTSEKTPATTNDLSVPIAKSIAKSEASKNSGWSLAGSVVKLLVQPKTQGVSLKDVISDLENLLSMFRRKYAQQAASNNPKLEMEQRNV